MDVIIQAMARWEHKQERKYNYQSCKLLLKM